MIDDDTKYLLSRRTFIRQTGSTLVLFALPINLIEHSKNNQMSSKKHFDTIIIGGSYSGLAAAMALGRALRKVLVIDSEKPCNKQTPHSHNFLTQDGKTPSEITKVAKEQVSMYNTVKFYNGFAIIASKTQNGFEIQTSSGDLFAATKLIFATGIKDLMPNIKGFSECWGISILHCPYCHGYEIKNETTAILGNGDYGFEFSRLISNWTKDLTLLTNGKSSLTIEQTAKLKRHDIQIVEKEIEEIEHVNGQLQNIIFKDGSKQIVKAIYTRLPFTQHSHIPEEIGCELSEDAYIKVDVFQKTSIKGVFACGDNTNRMRTVANAVATGTTAGMMVNKELIEEYF